MAAGQADVNAVSLCISLTVYQHARIHCVGKFSPVTCTLSSYQPTVLGSQDVQQTVR